NGSSVQGGLYDPMSETWTVISRSISGLGLFTAVWTGSEMIVWGDITASEKTNAVFRYNPQTNSWLASLNANVPEPRFLHNMIWTGSEMIVWGGISFHTSTNTGGRYDPATDSWHRTAQVAAPGARDSFACVWTG